MTLLLGILLAAQCSWTWAYRGASTAFPIPSMRWSRLLATPLFLYAAIYFLFPFDPVLTTSWLIDNGLTLGWNTAIVSWIGDHTWTFLILATGAFMFAQTPGWGRQMDLGDNNLPDNEWGSWIRDLIFHKKSSFSRDLTGLFMRMSLFLIPAFICLYHSVEAAYITASIAVVAPLIWVVEHLFIKNKVTFKLPWLGSRPMAWVEWGIGVYLAVLTILIGVVT